MRFVFCAIECDWTTCETRDSYSSRYESILIDEAQDVSKAQFEIVKLITAPQYNLFRSL